MRTRSLRSSGRAALGVCALVGLVLAVPAQASDPAPGQPSLRVSGILSARAQWQGLEGSSFSNIELDRAELGSELHSGDYGMVLRLETLRSAGPDGFLGIAQNAILPRVRFAYAEARPHLGVAALRARIGVIPDPWVEALEQAYDVRGLGPLASQRHGLFAPADIGVRGGVSLFGDLVSLDISLQNGEGHSQVEMNAGKDSALLLSFRAPTIDIKGPLRVALHGLYRDGSVGLGASRNHRAAIAGMIDHPWLHAGVEVARGFGYLGRGEREVDSFGAWLKGPIVAHWLGYAARAERFDSDLVIEGSERDLFSFALVSELRPEGPSPVSSRIRLYAGGEWIRAGDKWSPVPGVPEATASQTLFFVMESVGAWRSP